MTLAAFLFFILEAVLIFLCYFFPDLNELRWASGRVISAQKHEYMTPYTSLKKEETLILSKSHV